MTPMRTVVAMKGMSAGMAGVAPAHATPGLDGSLVGNLHVSLAGSAVEPSCSRGDRAHRLQSENRRQLLRAMALPAVGVAAVLLASKGDL